MKGLRVQCPGCKKVFHETTEKYDPDIRPNGAMVRLLEPWKGWGWAAFDAEGAAVSTTLCSEMLCPGCTAPLAPSGRLTVIITPEDAQKIQSLNSFSDDGSKILMEESASPQRTVINMENWPVPRQEVAKFDDQAAAEVTHAEPPTPGIEGGGELPQPVPVEVVVNELQIPIREDNPQIHVEGDKVLIVDPKNIVIEPPAAKKKKKANALKKKAKKRK
jgi:hypothetical protein